MGIALSDEHRELERTVHRAIEESGLATLAREVLETPLEMPEERWADLCRHGWLSLAVSEEGGGDGFGLGELAIVAEQMGRFLVPGPFLSTVLAALAIDEAASDGAPSDPGGVLRAILEGSAPVGVVVPVPAIDGRMRVPYALSGRREGDDLVLSGRLPAVAHAKAAAMLLVPVREQREPGSLGGSVPRSGSSRMEAHVEAHVEDGALGELQQSALQGNVLQGAGFESLPAEEVIWCLVDTDEAKVEQAASLDRSRRLATVEVEELSVPAERQLAPGASAVIWRALAVLVSAECAGVISWCLDTAVEHAKHRVQFGRPIGTFQGVKHRLADMLMDLEQVVACAADAAQAFDEWRAVPCPETAEAADLTGAIAAGEALDAAVEAAKGCIQVLGGLGFTWEHDAHLYLRRALALRQLAGPAPAWRVRAAKLATAGARRTLRVSLPPEAESFRDQVASEVDALAALSKEERLRAMAEGGWVAPHWPRPWGRDASPLEQLVIDEEFRRAGLSRPHLAVGAWALPTIIAYGTEDQKRRFVLPTLLGEITWCQLFSEPEAGSDLASLRMRAERREGGFVLTGQKVWTSMAAKADFGICLARSDPAAKRHEGITYFVVDMRSPGIEVRPLRELTGDAMFNEVFMDGVFVPDDCVIGEPNDGWRIARATLANERVSLSSGSTFGAGVEALIELVKATADPDAVTLDSLGRLIAEAQALATMGQRSTLRAVARLEPGAEASVRKLLGAEHEQRVQELALSLLGPLGAIEEGEGARFGRGFLVTRCLTIAGGTSEVQRNVIGERILGLPRDP